MSTNFSFTAAGGGRHCTKNFLSCLCINPTIFNCLQCNTLGCWVDGTIVSSTKCLMFQVFFFILFFCKVIKKIEKKYVEHQMLGRWDDRPIDPATQRIILKIVGFIHKHDRKLLVQCHLPPAAVNEKLVDIYACYIQRITCVIYFKNELRNSKAYISLWQQAFFLNLQCSV